MSDLECSVMQRLVAQRVKAIIMETFSVRNGIPRTILGEPHPAWIADRASNAAQALLGDEYLLVTSKPPEAK